MTSTNPMILVVEDDYYVREVTCRILKLTGYRVRAVENGQKALEELEREQFELVVTDLMMPVMDGIEFVRILRCIKKKLIPVIVMSGSTQDHLQSLAYPNLKALPKPYEMDDLITAVKSFVGNVA